MDEPIQSGLVASLEDQLDTAALGSPAAVLALVYARRIDECSHLRPVLEKALKTLAEACRAHPNPDRAFAALEKIMVTTSAVTVASDLGPKLLAALNELMLTPKAQAAALKGNRHADAANPLHGMRDEYAATQPEDEVGKRREQRNRR